MRSNPTSADHPAAPQTVDVVNGEAALPSLDLLQNGHYAKSGPDLIVTGADGQTVVVEGFFAGGEVALTAPGGAELGPDTVAALAGVPRQVADMTDAQLAQAATPIGTVAKASGNVTVQRADGSVVTLEPGDPVYQGDVVMTADGSSVGITFIDDTQFSLGSGGRMVLDDMVFDPASGEGEAGFNLVSGTFSFVSGQIAKAGPDAMQVTTPVATIGIRGTSGSISIGGDADLKVVLIPDPDGTVGEIQVTTLSGDLVSLNVPLGAMRITGGQAISFTMSSTEFNQSFGEALRGLPGYDVLQDRLNEVPQRQPDDPDTQQQPQDSQDDDRADLQDAPDTGDNPLPDGPIRVVMDDKDLVIADPRFEPAVDKDGAPIEDRNDQPQNGTPPQQAESQEPPDGTDDTDDHQDETGDTGDGSEQGNDATPSVEVSGTVIDPYVTGATVWLDYDNDGVRDANEPTATTNNDGDFTISGTQSAVLRSTGGTDSLTGVTVGSLSAPDGSTVMTPLTTLMQGMMKAGKSATAAQAAIADALDLDLGGVNLRTYDPVAKAQAGDSQGMDITAAGIIANGIAMMVAATLQGAGASASAAMNAAYSTLADTLAGITDRTTALDASTIESIINDAGSQFSGISGFSSKLSAAQSEAATAISNLVNKMDSEAAAAGDAGTFFTKLGSAAVVALQDATDDLKDWAAGTGDDPSDTYDTSNLDDLMAAAESQLKDMDGPTYGTSGNDSLMGGNGIDDLRGLDGNDVLMGQGGPDKLYGGQGDDILYGGDGGDVLNGGGGTDSLYGEGGDDRLSYGDGLDTIDGGDGTDTLVVSESGAISLDNVSNIERIDLSAGGSTLTLSTTILSTIGGAGIQDSVPFRIDGSDGGTLVLSDDGWTYGQDKTIDGTVYRTLSNGSYTLQVDSAIAIEASEAVRNDEDAGTFGVGQQDVRWFYGDMHIGDFDGDGYDDILMQAEDYTGYDSKAVIFFGGEAGGTRQTHINDITQGQYNAATIQAVGDLNGDGLDDIVFADDSREGGSGGTVILGRASWDDEVDARTDGAADAELTNGAAIGDSWLVDTDGDGQADWLYTSNDGQESPVGRATWQPSQPGNLANDTNYDPTTAGLLYGDFNGDGMATQSGHDAGNGDAFLAADVTRDGRDDVVGVLDGDTIAVLDMEEGATDFDQAQTKVEMGVSVHSIAVGDFNGDGFADVGFTLDRNDGEYLAGVIFGFAGTGPTTLDDLVSSGDAWTFDAGPLIEGARDLVMGDVNGDGYDDLILSNGGYGENDPNGARIIFGRNMSEAVTQDGTSGDDTLTGTMGTADIIVGGRGDDIIDGAGGQDVLRGGAGDDTISVFQEWALVDGGAGDDTLILSGPSQGQGEGGGGWEMPIVPYFHGLLDMTTIRGIETVRLGDAETDVQISIQASSLDGNALKIDGQSGDSVMFEATGEGEWQEAADQSGAAEGYTLYSHTNDGPVRAVQVADDISVAFSVPST